MLKIYSLSFTNGDEIICSSEHIGAFVKSYRQRGHALVTSKPMA